MKDPSSRVSPNFTQLLQCLRNVDHNLSIERIPEKVLLLMGETKAGKTTLLYYLLKKKLVFEVNELGIRQMKPDAVCFNAFIGNGYDSTTVYPNIPTYVDQDECLIIDMPGFNDTRPLYRFLNIYIIISVIRRIKALHISFVLPFQSLQGQALRQALQNSCPLLSGDFLRAQRSFSFILTKIEDSESDLAMFKQQMQELKESYEQEAIGQVLSSFQNKNTYIFCSKEPDLEEGANLKKQIIRENCFFSEGEGIDKIISENYENIIIGKGDRQEFHSYLQTNIKQLTQYLPIIINTLTSLFKYHHQTLLTKLGIEFQSEQFNKRLEELKLINFVVAPEWASIRQSIQFGSVELQLISFAAKMRKTMKQFKNQDKRWMHDLQCLVQSSNYLTKEMSKISDLLREAIYHALKDCYVLIETLISISSKTDIKLQPELDLVFQSQDIQKAVGSYFELIQDEEKLAKIMELPQARNLMLNDQFSSVISYYNPRYAPAEGQVMVVQQLVPVCHKINKKWMEKPLDITSQQLQEAEVIEPEPRSISLSNNQHDKILEQLQKLPNSHSALSILLKSLSSMKNVDARQTKQVLFLKNLLTKTIQVLSTLGFIQQAILFAISLSDQSELEKLIERGIKFEEISPQFIQTVLIPFILNVELDLKIYEKLYSYLLQQADSSAQIIQIQTQYVKNLSQMRRLLDQGKGESQYQRNRFNLQLIESLIEGQYSVLLLQRAEERNKMLRKCGFRRPSVQNALLQISRCYQ